MSHELQPPSLVPCGAWAAASIAKTGRPGLAPQPPSHHQVPRDHRPACPPHHAASVAGDEHGRHAAGRADDPPGDGALLPRPRPAAAGGDLGRHPGRGAGAALRRAPDRQSRGRGDRAAGLGREHPRQRAAGALRPARAKATNPTGDGTRRDRLRRGRAAPAPPGGAAGRQRLQPRRQALDGGEAGDSCSIRGTLVGSARV